MILNIKKKWIPELLKIMCSNTACGNIDMGIDLLRYRIKVKIWNSYLSLKYSQDNKNNKIYLIIDYIGQRFRRVNVGRVLNVI